MHCNRISADSHIDLPCLPPDLFAANAPAALKDRMPHVVDGHCGEIHRRAVQGHLARGGAQITCDNAAAFYGLA